MSCRGCVCGSGSPSENVPPSTAAPTNTETLARGLGDLLNACGWDVEVRTQRYSHWDETKQVAAAFRSEDHGDVKMDARSYVAGFKMGVKIGKQDAALETYADNIALSDPDKPR